MDSLNGHFLISTTQMSDPRFQEQVIFICAHNDEGAMGLVINNPSPYITVRDVMISADIAVPETPLPPVYMGGPVETDAGFILLSSEYSNSHLMEITPSIFLSRDVQVLFDIAQGVGPDLYLFMLGYAGWGAGQLEAELLNNGWLTVPGDFDVLFNTPDESKWKLAAHRFGVDHFFPSTTAALSS